MTDCLKVVDTRRGVACVEPSESIAEEFEHLVDPLLARIAQNDTETKILSQIYSDLLPKLMSGEVCLRDAEKQVEEAL